MGINSVNWSIVISIDCLTVFLIVLWAKPEVVRYTGTSLPVWIRSFCPLIISYCGDSNTSLFLNTFTLPLIIILEFNLMLLLSHGWLNHMALILPLSSDIMISVDFFLGHTFGCPTLVTVPIIVCSLPNWSVDIFLISVKS